jgi:hypothetical protein
MSRRPSLRSALYRTARWMGDANAVERAVERGSLAPIEKRIERRLFGRLFGRIIGWLTR